MISKYEVHSVRQPQGVAIATRNQTKSRENKLTYDELLANYLSNNETLIEWLKEYGLLANEVMC